MNLIKDFKILNENKKFIYLDSANTTFKPNIVIRKIEKYSILLDQKINKKIIFKNYLKSLFKIKKFVSCPNDYSVLLFKSVTEGIEYISDKIIFKKLNKNDEIIISDLEHRSNFSPWKCIQKKKKIKLNKISFNKNGELNLKSFKKLINKKTKLVSLTNLSPFYGNEVSEKILDYCKNSNIPFLIDACQSLISCKIDLRKLNSDFFIFSSHKMYGPMGLGVLIIKKKYLAKFNEFNHNKNYLVELEGLSAAIDYINKKGRYKIMIDLVNLTQYLENKLSKFNQIKIFGKSKNRKSIISFILRNDKKKIFHSFLIKSGFFIRYGHHHCHNLLKKLKLKKTFRISLGIYNSKKDIDLLIKNLNLIFKK